jgi:CHAT domain-containing protein
MGKRPPGLVRLLALVLPLGVAPVSNAAENPLEQGMAAFQRGAVAEAATRWAEAARACEAARDLACRISALTYLARAQTALGQYRQAQGSLETAAALVVATDNRRAAASIDAALGNVYLVLGPPEAAESHLRKALAAARSVPDPALTAATLNDLGNLLATQKRYEEALAAYRESIALATSPGLRVLRARARINAAAALREEQRARDALTALDAALGELRVLPPSHEVVFALVSVGAGYRDLRPLLPDDRDRLTVQAASVFTYAGRSAEAIADRRTASYAWGYLGGLYEDEKRYPEALELAYRAIFAAQQVSAPESLYRWQWQVARLLRASGRTDEAIAEYRRAVATLQGVRPELAAGYGGSSASFRDTVGALYFEAVDVLLERARGASGGDQVAPYLVEARQTVELFKVAELRDYFRDDCVDTALSKVAKLDVVSRTAVVVYPILLADRLELLVSLPSGLKSVVVPVDMETVTAEVRQFRRMLEKRTTRQYLPHARTLYKWLIAPLETDLKQAQIDTVVFVPDGPLRTIPMAALHDGNQFLVNKYAIAITPGLDLTDPQPIHRERAKVLAAGVTEPVQGFSALPGVAAEIAALRTMFKGTTLMNGDFVEANLKKELKDEQFTILHIASHGQFGASPSQTFVLTFDTKLSMEQLDQYIGLFKYRDNPLELLTLSACDTAEGDDRAALGLAGVAVRAGARSAVATFWEVHDEVAAELVTQFYRELQDRSVSRAVALQRAQIKVLSNPRYQHPGYWSAFLMINNWL